MIIGRCGSSVGQSVLSISQCQSAMDRWANKVAVVTGAGAGMGAQFCRDLCAHNVSVYGLDINEGFLENTAKSIAQHVPGARFHPIRCDLSKEEQIVAAFEQILSAANGIDILVNCAGVVSPRPLLEGSIGDIERVLQTNVMAMLSCTKKAIQSMRDRDVEGYVVNMCSAAGHGIHVLPGPPLYTSYYISKHSVRVFNQMLAQELKYLDLKKIRMTNISPGAVGGTSIAAAGELGALKQLLDSEGTLTAKDVSDQLIHILSSPPHVVIRDLIIETVGFPFY